MLVLLAGRRRVLSRSVITAFRSSGFFVDVVHTTDELFQRSRANPYACVVFACCDSSGDEDILVREIRFRKFRNRVIALVEGDADVRVLCLDSGADDVVSLPFALSELVARVRAAVRTLKLPPVASVGDLRLDPATGCMERAGERISLTPAEFRILHLLMAHAGRIVSAQELMKQAVQPVTGQRLDVISVYIYRLRKKMEFEGDRPLIETVRGSGFRLRVESHAIAQNA